MNETTVAENTTVYLMQRLLSWSESGILDLRNMDTQTVATAAAEFAESKSIVHRDWSNSFLDLNTSTPFNMGILPMSMAVNKNERAHAMGVYNGWSLGVYKYASNPDAAMKLVKYLTSMEYQRKMVLEATYPVIPTYPQLLNGMLFWFLKFALYHLINRVNV